MTKKDKISVIIPVTEIFRKTDIINIVTEYSEALSGIAAQFEFVIVIDGEFHDVYEDLHNLIGKNLEIKIVKMSKEFGEATAITVGVEHAKYELILSLPAYKQIQLSELPKLLESLQENDMAICWRYPRRDKGLNKLMGQFFNWLMMKMTDYDFHDLGCGVRFFKKAIFDEIDVYGDQHRFIPLLAGRVGFKVKEVQVKQAEEDVFKRLYPPSTYGKRLLDLLSIFFLLKFTKKPLRFFGSTGTFLFSIGLVLSFFLFIQRIFFDVALADRPIVLVGLLFIVLGIQIFAIGLIGELIIFTHARHIKEYTIEKVIN